MKHITIEQLKADNFYWARRKLVPGAPAAEPHDIEIIQISTTFGAAPEFWTVATMGTDEHFGLEDYDFFHKVPSPPIGMKKRTGNLALVSPLNQSIGH
jgi:hypothetical protein